LARMAEVLAGEYQVVRQSIQLLWEWMAPADEQLPGQALINRAAWRGLSADVQRDLLRRGAEQVLGDTRDLGFEPLEAAAAFARRAETGRSCDVARGLRLEVAPQHIVLYLDQPQTAQYPLL